MDMFYYQNEIVVIGLVKYFILYLPQWQFLDYGIKLEVVMAFKIKNVYNKPSLG